MFQTNETVAVAFIMAMDVLFKMEIIVGVQAYHRNKVVFLFLRRVKGTEQHGAISGESQPLLPLYRICMDYLNKEC